MGSTCPPYHNSTTVEYVPLGVVFVVALIFPNPSPPLTIFSILLSTSDLDKCLHTEHSSKGLVASYTIAKLTFGGQFLLHVGQLQICLCTDCDQAQ